MRILRARSTGGDQGSLVVEFGLIILPMMMLIGALIFFGSLFAVQVQLTNAAREGVRIFALEGESIAVVRDVTLAQLSMDAIDVKAGRIDSSGESSENELCELPGDAAQGIDVYVDAIRTVRVPVPVLGPMGGDLTGRAVMRCGG